MLDNDTRAKLLKLYPMLAEVPPAEMEALLATANAVRLPAGTTVFDENQTCRGFPLMLSGVIRIIKASPNGRELQLYRVTPGESCILTSGCLLGHARYQARGVVEHDAEMVLLPASSFHELLGKYEGFRNYVFNLFSERLTDMMQLITAVAFQKLDQRLAKLLISRSSPIHTTHQALADELGSAREMVSRLLKGFAEHGWVEVGREHIDVVDAAALKKFAEL